MEWSDEDVKWNRVSQTDKQKIGDEKNPKDGIFFLEYNDSCDWLTRVSIAELYDGYSYVYCSQQAASGKGCFFKVGISKQGEYSFQLSQTPSRLAGGYSYQTATMNIGRILPNGDLEYFLGNRDAYQTIYRKHILPPRDYIVNTEQFFRKEDPFQDATVAVCGQYYCTIVPFPGQLNKQFHEKLFLSRASK